MNEYKEWLVLTCKYAIGNLNREEFLLWGELTTKLDKRCKDCVDGYVCFTCHNTGLKLTTEEASVMTNLETAIKRKQAFLALHSEETRL